MQSFPLKQWLAQKLWHSSKNYYMYTSQVTTQDEALCHLFFHCCLKDGQYSESEIDESAGLMVEFGLQKSLHFKDELIKYRSYITDVTSLNEEAYLKSLIDIIQPVNKLALYSYCVELTLSDAYISAPEESLLEKLATVLEVEPAEKAAIDKLMIQRKVIQKEKIC